VVDGTGLVLWGHVDVDCRVESGMRRNVMPRHLKRGVDASAIQAADAKVREMVEQILADVDAHKDAAVRELSGALRAS
jgi:hypothetical protein